MLLLFCLSDTQSGFQILQPKICLQKVRLSCERCVWAVKLHSKNRQECQIYLWQNCMSLPFSCVVPQAAGLVLHAAFRVSTQQIPLMLLKTAVVIDANNIYYELSVCD